MRSYPVNFDKLILFQNEVRFVPFSTSPGHNQIWIYDDVTHICKMAPTPRNTREGHFLALCCA